PAAVAGRRRASDALCPRAGGAEPAQQDIVGAAVLRVQLQAVALEPLRLDRAALDRLGLLGRDREAEHRQPAVLFPELADAPCDTVAGLGKAALAGCLRRAGYVEQRGGDRNHEE